MINRLRVARGLGLATIVLMFVAVVTGQAHFTLLFSAGLQLALVFALGARRWRFPAAVCFGMISCEQLLWATLTRDEGFLPVLLLPGALCSALGAAAILWPRLRAASDGAPLPRLSGAWALVSALGVAVVDACLIVVWPGGRVPQAVLLMGLSALLLFFGLMLASHAGRLRWLLQPAAVAASGLATFTLPGVINLESTAVAPLELAAFAGAALAFALGFDWIRSATTARARVARAAAAVWAGGLVPAVIAAPYQLSLRSLALPLAHALAFGVAAGLAPRIAGARRERHGRWVPAIGLPHRLGWSLAAIVVLPCVTALAATRFHIGPVLPGIAAGVILVVSTLRARVFRALIWLITTLPMLVIAFADGPGFRLENGFYAFIGLMVATWLSWAISSPRHGVHFFRRWVGPPSPSPRVSLALGAVALAAAAAFMARTATPSTRGLLLARLAGPVSFESTLLFDPPVARVPAVPALTGGTVAEDPLGRGTWVVDEERDSVMLVGASGPPSVVAVGAWPEQLVVDPFGRVFVSCRGAGRVDVIDLELKVRSFAAGPEPRGLALDPAARTLYVGLVTASELVSLDAKSGAVLGRVTLGAPPYFVAVSRGEIAALPRVGSALYLASADLGRVREVELTSGSRRAWHGQALVPAGDDLLVVNASVDTGLDEGEAGRRFGFRGDDGYGGGVASPVELHVAQLHRGELIVRPPGLEQTFGVGEITGAALSGEHLALVSRGTGSMITIPLERLSRGDVSLNQTGLGEGLTGLARSGDGELVTYAAFDRTLQRVRPWTGTAGKPVSLGPSTVDPELALGRRLFHRTDERKTSGAGLACATCHPDGREDGLVWSLKGARLQTPILAEKLAHTAPYNWYGTAPTLEESLAQTIQRLGGSGLKAPELKALARYLTEGLRAPVKPEVVDAKLVALGSEVFHRSGVGCADCHTTDGSLTDGARHDVGTLDDAQRQRLVGRKDAEKDPASFDTPSLLSVGLTAPYFHDGSAPTLEAMLAGNRDRMGHTSELTEVERKALVAFLKTL